MQTSNLQRGQVCSDCRRFRRETAPAPSEFRDIAGDFRPRLEERATTPKLPMETGLFCWALTKGLSEPTPKKPPQPCDPVPPTARLRISTSPSLPAIGSWAAKGNEADLAGLTKMFPRQRNFLLTTVISLLKTILAESKTK